MQENQPFRVERDSRNKNAATFSDSGISFSAQASEQCPELLFQRCTGDIADVTVHDLSITEEEDRGDIADRITHGDIDVLLDVASGDRYAGLLLLGQLLDNGGQRTARTAPLGTEIDHEKRCGGQ